MPDVRAIAAAYGVRVELANLGDWGRVHLVAEYDPEGPVIRVDPRVILSLSKDEPKAGPCPWRILRQAQDDIVAARDSMDAQCGDECDGVELAIAHELYHHREAIGEIPRIAERAAREAAADAFAKRLVRECAGGGR
jgi:hypothetical protein